MVDKNVPTHLTEEKDQLHIERYMNQKYDKTTGRGIL